MGTARHGLLRLHPFLDGKAASCASCPTPFSPPAIGLAATTATGATI